MKELKSTILWLVVLWIVWYLFILILKWYFWRTNTKNTIYTQPNLNTYDSQLKQQYKDELNDFLINNNLWFEEKVEYCKELEDVSYEIWYDHLKIYDWCLYTLLSWWLNPYDEKICWSMKWWVFQDIPIPWAEEKIIVSYKDKCYSDIAIYKWDISKCKNQWRWCLLYSVEKLLDNEWDIDCGLLDENNKRICETYKFNIKYSYLLTNYMQKEVSDPELLLELKNIASEGLNKFWTIENLCNSFSKDLPKIYPENNLWENKLYNRCIHIYMENQNQYNIETCKKLKYSILEDFGEFSITEKDSCISENIIDNSKNIKDCQYADNNTICVWIVAYVLWDDSNCESLSSNVNKQLCYKASWKEMPRSLSISRKNCRIKWNISFNWWEKIYHLPWCENYNDTVINTSYWERRFCTEEEAMAAGRRKARNCY